MSKKVALSFGTRPELIKVLPVFRELINQCGRDRILLIHTGQHSDLLDQELSYYKITPDVRFELDRNSGSLSELTGKLLLKFEELSEQLTSKGVHLSAMIAQGDTASTYVSALHAFHQKVPFFHVEAGLRTYDNMNPFPEEFYRRSISEMASLHFAPTKTEYQHLINEQKKSEDIIITGNTVIDHLLNLKRNIHSKEVIITLHRRELTDSDYQEMVDYFKILVPKSEGWNFNWVTHPNRRMGFSELEQLPNFKLLDPIPFYTFLDLYKTSGLIFTDSGGIQEEAAFLGIPCVVCRKTTERFQGIDAGIAKLFDSSFTNMEQILAAFNGQNLIQGNTIYGDGHSAKRIVEAIKTRIL